MRPSVAALPLALATACYSPPGLQPGDGGPADGEGPDGSPPPTCAYPDAGGRDAPPPPAGCSTVAMLGDDFQAPARALVWWRYPEADGNGTTIVEDGRLVLEAGAAADSWAGYLSVSRHDLRDGKISVEVVEVPADPLAWSGLTAAGESGRGDYFAMFVSDGRLTCEHSEGGVTDSRTGIYDAMDHRLWRIREAAGTTYLETRPAAGTTWTPCLTAVSPPWLRYARVFLQTGHDEATTGATRAIFDDVNGGAPTGSFCPAASLVDDFEGGGRGLAWMESKVESCAVVERCGLLSFTPPAAMMAGGFDCFYGSSAAYDLTGSEVVVEIAEMVTGPDVSAYLWLGDLQGNWLQIAQQQGFLTASAGRTDGGYGQLSGRPWDPVAQRYWRIRHDGAQVFLETAPARTGPWTGGSPLADVPVAALQVYIGVSSLVDLTTAPGTAAFAGVNAP